MTAAKKKNRLTKNRPEKKRGKQRNAGAGEAAQKTEIVEVAAPKKTFRRPAPRQPKILVVLAMLVVLWLGFLIYLARVVNT